MGAKTFRVTVSFDEEKEKDIIELLEYFAERRQLGSILSNLLRIAVDDKAGDKGNQPLNSLTTPSLSATRQKFFNGVVQILKDQDIKIDTIYSMCEDLYGLARANKAIGLESKVDNLMFSQFLLQNQQSKTKKILGIDNLQHLYESDKLSNEKEKADKIWEYIAEVYGGMIAELRPYLFKGIEVPVNSSQGVSPARPTGIQSSGVIVDKAKGHEDSNGQYIPADDDIIDLNSEPEIDSNSINIPTGDAASLLLDLMK